jgi:1-aminocyclopropane-1-carboxylate deaminase
MPNAPNPFEKFINLPTPLRRLNDPLFENKGIQVWVKEDYLTHKEVSGNKFRKLKYNLLEARAQGKNKLLSFGGAYSNHIHALAAAGKLWGFHTLGIIRGHELSADSGQTLKFASEQGMELKFVDRAAYRNKEELIWRYNDSWYVLPEGGSNQLALRGCSEMTDEILKEIHPTHLCLSAGTGGTAAGILSNRNFNGKLEVFPALKNGEFLKSEIENLAGNASHRLNLHTDYHFGGYGKINTELSEFIEFSESKYSIPLDPVYTGKLFAGVLDLIRKDYFFRGSVVVIYHSGGLQGKLSSK